METVVVPTVRSKRRLGLLAVLGALSSFGPLSMDMYLPSTPTIAASLHASQSLVQLTLSGCLAGLALGQLVAGPLSDGLGRKKPLLVGLVAFTVLSVACAAAPDIAALIAFRFLQGVAGAGGVVLSLAIVRDLYTGTELARVLSSLMLVFGLAPVLAPVIGGQILRFTSWRGVFGVLAAIGLVTAGHIRDLNMGITAEQLFRVPRKIALADLAVIEVELQLDVLPRDAVEHGNGLRRAAQEITGIVPPVERLDQQRDPLGRGAVRRAAECRDVGRLLRRGRGAGHDVQPRTADRARVVQRQLEACIEGRFAAGKRRQSTLALRHIAGRQVEEHGIEAASLEAVGAGWLSGV